MKTNEKNVVMMGLQGEISHPENKDYVVSHDGRACFIPRSGSINYNVKLGDSVMNWVGEDITPGVSTSHPKKDQMETYVQLACIGNEARVISGEAKGVTGYVTGKMSSQGQKQITIDFKEEDQESMQVGDKIFIKSYGQGLGYKDFPQVKVMNIDPKLLKVLGVREEKGSIIVPVKMVIDQHFNGSGTGEGGPLETDISIGASALEDIKEHGMDDLKFGDLVLLRGSDNVYGTSYLEKASSIGIVVSGQSQMAGRGPGVAVIMSSKDGIIKEEISVHANLSTYLPKLK